MGRPKVYATRAAQQAAYRQRLQQEMVVVNRAAFTQWDTRLTALLTAIRTAAQAGDPLAQRLAHNSEAGMMNNLTTWFVERGKGEHAIGS